MFFLKKNKNISDSDLAGAIILNDKKAFEILIKRYEQPLFGFCFGFVQNSHEAEDMVQDTFLKFYEALETLDPKKSIKSFLFKIARNRCIDNLRKKKPQYLGSITESSLVYDPCEEFLKSEQEKNLYKAINELGENERTIIFLKYKSGLKYSEIAEIINKSESAVESVLVRARKKIRQTLQEIED